MAGASRANAGSAKKAQRHARQDQTVNKFSSCCTFIGMKRSIQFFVLLLVSLSVFSQRRLTEATLRYSISLADTTDRSLNDLFKSAQYTCYLKGINSRTDLVTGMGKQTTLLLGKSGIAILLKEFGSQRYLSRLTVPQWNSLNQKYEDSKLEITGDTTRLLGFLCKKAIITLQDGTRHGA